ncbi:MAG: M48 family metallopeptidase [Alphaproteobacteria bacterium]|nr:M48 family metallopeptidase [Alphaproteobacteria bacterium]
MTEFVIGNLRVPYALQRSERASRVHIEMTMDAMRVTAPADVSSEEINSALYRKRRWIVENHYALAEKYAQTHKIARFRTGAKVPYWGRLAALRTEAADVHTPEVTFRNNGFVVRHHAQPTARKHDDVVEGALKGWLRERLRIEARQASNRYAKALGVEVTALRVGELRTCWGSCGARGSVSVDWHLVFGPKRVVHYVIAHELAHLVERNHSPSFWRVVRRAFGDFQAEHNWLTRNEHLLGYRRLPLGGVNKPPK